MCRLLELAGETTSLFVKRLMYDGLKYEMINSYHWSIFDTCFRPTSKRSKPYNLEFNKPSNGRTLHSFRITGEILNDYFNLCDIPTLEFLEQMKSLKRWVNSLRKRQLLLCLLTQPWSDLSTSTIVTYLPSYQGPLYFLMVKVSRPNPPLKNSTTKGTVHSKSWNQ